MNLLLVEKNKQKGNVRFEIAYKERKCKAFSPQKHGGSKGRMETSISDCPMMRRKRRVTDSPLRSQWLNDRLREKYRMLARG
jgi:hypothetical protein